MKKVLYVIIGLVVVYIILCIAGPKASKIERTIVINAPMEAVNAAIIDHKVFQDKWSPWTEKDPGMKVTFEGEMGKPGHKMAWESDSASVGIGSMTINSISAYSIIQTLRFDNHESKIYHILKNENGATNVVWGLSSEFPFFARGIVMVMNAEKQMEEMIAPDFEKGLANLKTYLESSPATPVVNYDVKEVDFPETNLIGTKKQKLTMDKVEGFFGENLGKIMEDLLKYKIEPLSAPSALYYDFNNEFMSADVVACFAAPKGAKVKGWENYEFPAGKAVKLEYHGGYDDMMAAHDAIKNYIKEKNLSFIVTYEEYVTDPMTEKDSTKWLTNIYYILK